MTITLDGTLGVTTPAETITGTLAVTGITTVAAGSAALPSIVSTTGTADTGMWFPAADTVAWSTAGSERVRITSTGLVGIGTAAPTSSLVVSGTIEGVPSIVGVHLGMSVSGLYAAVEMAAATGSYIDFTQTGTDTKGRILYDNASNFLGFTTNGVERMRIDSSGNMLVTSAAGLGYGTGSGGTVTQATSKTTAVTLNKPTGRITMTNDALGGGSSISFNLANSLVGNFDVLVASLPQVNIALPSDYSVRAGIITAGTAQFTIKNETGGSLSQAVVINFAIIRGATS